MRQVKILGLAAIATMALMAFMGPASAGPAGFLFVSFSILSAAALGIGTAREFDASSSLTFSPLTVNETVNTVTSEFELTTQANDQLPNSHYDRETLPLRSVLAC